MTKCALPLSGCILAFFLGYVAPALNAQTAAVTCGGAQARVRSGQLAIDRDQDAIRSLGFEKRVEEVNDWQKLSADARSQFMSETLDGLLAVAAKGNQWAGSLSPPTANRAISRLRAAGINIKGLNDSIRALASGLQDGFSKLAQKSPLQFLA